MCYEVGVFPRRRAPYSPFRVKENWIFAPSRNDQGGQAPSLQIILLRWGLERRHADNSGRHKALQTYFG
jgi:hypothetical protein